MEGEELLITFYVSSGNDSILWFGNRGYGAYRMNVKTEVMMPFRFDQEVSNQAVNDILPFFQIKRLLVGY